MFMEIGRNSETNRFTGAALAGIAAISLTGCSESSIEEFPEASVTYEDGIRIVNFDSEHIADTISYCDGNEEDGYDLVEVNALNLDGDGGNSMTRTPDHKACENGTLTEDDFSDSFLQ
jgi:hypothetical protein